MTQSGLMGAVLYAKDMDRLVRFYSAVTGIAPRAVHEGHAILGSNPQEFIIVRMPRRIADTIEIAVPPEAREDTPIKLIFAVESIADARERAAALGGALNAAKREWTFQGDRVCDGLDPEGNVFQLRQSLPPDHLVD